MLPEPVFVAQPSYSAGRLKSQLAQLTEALLAKPMMLL
jgi:hypothetical protein